MRVGFRVRSAHARVGKDERAVVVGYEKKNRVALRATHVRGGGPSRHAEATFTIKCYDMVKQRGS